MNVLVVATDRSQKIAQPLTAVECDVSVVSPNTRTNSFKRNANIIIQTWREITKNEFDVVIVRGTGLIGFACILIGFIFSIPVISRVAGDKFEEYKDHCLHNLKNRKFIGVLHIILRMILFIICMIFSTGIIVVSEHLRDKYDIFSRLANQTIIVIPVSINIETPGSRDDEHHKVRDLYTEGHNLDTRLLLTVTNLDFYKKYLGVIQSIQGITPVLQDRPNVEYVIAGNGRYQGCLESYIEETIADEGVRERIHVVGYVDTGPLYNHSSLFVYFSHLDGYPNVVLEAMSSRLPIITNDGEGMSEQIIDQTSGLFVDPKDPSEIRIAVDLLLKEKSTRESLSSTAYDIVSVRNSHTTVGKEYVDKINKHIID